MVEKIVSIIIRKPIRMSYIRSIFACCSRFFARVFDILVSISVLILSLPIIVIISSAIKIDSPGPVIFRQVRLGKNRKPFVFYKFRAMYADAKERFPELYKYTYAKEEVEVMYFKVENDPRLTRIGKILRKTTLDELPNFINLLKGDMALIGPRPDIPEMITYYKPWQMKKFDVKPGITGLAQTKGRGLLRFQETLKYDVCYVENKNWILDLKILLNTFKVTLLRIGAF